LGIEFIGINPVVVVIVKRRYRHTGEPSRNPGIKEHRNISGVNYPVSVKVVNKSVVNTRSPDVSGRVRVPGKWRYIIDMNVCRNTRKGHK